MGTIEPTGGLKATQGGQVVEAKGPYVFCLVSSLTLTVPEAYERLGTYAQMNPPIREAHHRDALWRAVNRGVVDVLVQHQRRHCIPLPAMGRPWLAGRCGQWFAGGP